MGTSTPFRLADANSSERQAERTAKKRQIISVSHQITLADRGNEEEQSQQASAHQLRPIRCYQLAALQEQKQSCQLAKL